MSSSLNLKSIFDIIRNEMNFFIPSYQRGYKWDRQQVEDLLNDIYDFSTKKSLDSEFYCLQPIVVLKENERYRIIDGQQRITTIYIILKYLEDILNDEYFIDKFYTIEYETRDESRDFLNQKLKDGIDDSNSDFYHISRAYKVIEEWFVEKIKNREISKRKFIDILLGSDDKDVKFIWYELDKSEDEIDVFMRLNIGKIPLSNAELIKALLLYENSENEKREIISMWDNIEKSLQNSKFFSFLTKQEYRYTKIDFIFNLIARKYNKKLKKFNEDDEKFSFYIFEYLIKENPSNKKLLWSEVKDYFRIFEEFYHNNIYYHYIGYFINSNEKNSIEEIINLFREYSKEDFENRLKKLITIRVKKSLKELSYDDDYKSVEKILFLFNVIITMDSGYSRYPFDIHNRQKWSLEHIHAQNSENITRDIDMRTILESQLELIYISDELKDEIKEILKNISQQGFYNLQEKIFKLFSDETSIHTIDNLALLSRDNNSSLSNVLFPQKRDKLKELDSKGEFIPLGTKNVFMKYYSSNVKENLTWNREDRESYLKELERVLSNFIEE